jgi:hypothetical protein
MNSKIQNPIVFMALLIFIFLTPLIAQDSKQPLPDGYRDIHLGMTLDDTKKSLINDSLFGYRGDRDVSLLPSENKSLIETIGSKWLNHSWFQFYKEKLYTITINFNSNELDYNSLFTTLSKKYGDPVSLSPEKTIWENDSIQLVLEQPCSIKYIDLKVFNSLLEQSTIEKSALEIVRQNLLDEL